MSRVRCKSALHFRVGPFGPAAAPPRQDLPLILDLDEEARSSESAEPRRKRAKRLPERFREPPAGAASTGASPRAPAARPALTSAGSGANEARISQTTIRVRKGNVRGAISPRAGAVGVHTLAGSKAAGSSAPRIRLVIRRPGAHSGVLLKDELVAFLRAAPGRRVLCYEYPVDDFLPCYKHPEYVHVTLDATYRTARLHRPASHRPSTPPPLRPTVPPSHRPTA